MYSWFYSKKYKKFAVHFWIKREGVVLSENQGHVYWLLFYLKSYTWLFSTKDIKCSLNPQSVSLMQKFWMAHPFKAFDNAYNMVVRIINLFPESCEELKTKKWQEKFDALLFDVFSHGLVLRSFNIFHFN